jgi:hypothetical protein
MADSYKPYLRFRSLGQQVTRSDESRVTHSIISGFNIDRYDLAPISCFDLSAYLSLVYLIAASGGLFGRVARML